jgi:hypothetical protein
MFESSDGSKNNFLNDEVEKRGAFARLNVETSPFKKEKK